MISVQIYAGDHAGKVVAKNDLESAKSLVVEHYQAGGAAYIVYSPESVVPHKFLTYDPADNSWTDSDYPPEM